MPVRLQPESSANNTLSFERADNKWRQCGRQCVLTTASA
jgi:hypothetical protein